MATPVTDAPAVRRAIERSADARAAGAAIERFVEAHPDRADAIAAGGILLDAVAAIAVASQSLFAGLLRDREAVAVVAEPGALATATTDDGSAELLGGALGADDPAGELRWRKRRSLVRIAARDLLGIADLRTTGVELAAVAQACLAVALDIAKPDVTMAVIAMGKLGGRELNYASDVDVMFVHDGDAREADRVAQAVLRVMSDQTADGIVFRTDVALRPEGRAGALSRPLGAYTAYWDRWARAWEFQALLKARGIAGDRGLAARFLQEASRRAFPEAANPDLVREVRAMKARSESELRRLGLDEREVKRGRGGIRDIEFSVQLLQLVHGRTDVRVRTPTTLDALEVLAAGGYIASDDADRLVEAYVWLRTVEHRLQLVDEQQTHTLPVATDARTRLARVLGFRDHAHRSALQQFDERHRAQQGVVRGLHEKLFFAPILDTLSGAGALTPAAAEERLSAFGFSDIARTRAALRELSAGLTRHSRVMHQLLPVVLGWLSDSPDPDLGLLQLRRLTEGAARADALAHTFRETPIAAERACRVLGSSRVLGLALHRQPDFLSRLGNDEHLGREHSRAELVTEAVDALGWRADEPARRAGLRRFKRRHLLRIGARDVLGLADLETTQRELAHVADACVEAALQGLEPSAPFAVIGLGRLGGEELSYASDVDVLFVYDGEGASEFDAAERLATGLVQALGATTAEGQVFGIDANLRPEGRQGPLARSLRGYARYYDNWALTWEFQSLLRARPVAGDPAIAERFLDLVRPFVYRDPLPDADVREIRRMKARIERERIRPGEDPQFHLKLGRGSLSDIEFTVQLLQLVHGAAHEELRVTSIGAALDGLTATGLLGDDDADSLRDAYRLCERARNARYLLTNAAGESLPVQSDLAEPLGRMLGFVHQPQTSLRDEYRRVTRRARSVVERVFYGRT
ncbi:MAG TPA: bifunctional [glutamine synthetase] adenylyltransferase/[glutamine synthetase]-adenylyl-L-tyrosine phosphorylase [Acidimicrobiia bacterium]